MSPGRGCVGAVRPVGNHSWVAMLVLSSLAASQRPSDDDEQAIRPGRDEMCLS
jgi:hypothetical protein